MIEIAAYQERWVGEFEAAAESVAGVLGSHALRIDHIGSTAVVGLAAKDVIDLQVSVAGFGAIEEIRARMAAAGYAFRGHGILDHAPAGWETTPEQWEKAYFRERPGERRTHIHVRASGRQNQRYALLFRDFLRASPKVAAGYAAVKVELARLLGQGDDHQPYVDAKDPVIDIIMAQAEEWAERVGWDVPVTG